MPRQRAGKDKELEIPEDEQLRLVKESGILSQIQGDIQVAHEQEEGEGLSPFTEELCYAIFFIIPFSFCLLVMDILIHYQYGRNPTLEELLNRMIPGIPIISIFIFYTLRYKEHRQVQLGLFILSCFAGSRLIWMLNKANWLDNMDQCPPLATAWIFAVVMLDLGPSVVSLLTIGSYVWYAGLKLSL